MDQIPEIVLKKSTMFGKKKRRHHKKQSKGHKIVKKGFPRETIDVISQQKPEKLIVPKVTISPRI